MKIVKWNPYRNLITVGGCVGNVLRECDVPRSLATNQGGGPWIPTVDVSETPEAHIIQIEAPGIAKGDLKISLEEDRLTVAGEKRPLSNGRDGSHYSERRFGQFERVFRLPRVVDRERISARYAEGVLSIRLPKAPEAKAKDIAIE